MSVYDPYITMVDNKGYDVKLGLYTDFLCGFGIPYYGTPLLNNIPLWPTYLPQEYDAQRGGSRYLGFLENGRPLENPDFSEEKYTGKKDYIPYPWFDKDLNAPINKQKITYDEWEIIATQLPDDLPRSLRDYYSQFTYWCVDKYPTTVFLTAYYEDDKDNLKHETYFLELNDLFKPFG